jgi:sulfite oxidase
VVELSLADLTTGFASTEVTATLVCAGMRRREFLQLGPLPGELPWATEPIGTARWRGVALREVLAAAGIGSSARHVAFTGLDLVERRGTTFGFGGSISLSKAADPSVLIALRMNDEVLPSEHGFPARIVAPGWIGARSVKWLHRIELRSEPSDNYFQTQAYRVQAVASQLDPRDVSRGPALGEVAINAVILRPRPGGSVGPGPLAVEGWAIGTGGRALARVELSSNGGRDWTNVELGTPLAGGGVWQMFRATVTLEPGEHELVVRAVDVTGETQPAELRRVWNVKGYANNAWHRVRVRVDG